MKTKNSLIVALMFLAKSLFAGVAITNGLTHVYNGVSGNIITGEIILVNTTDIEQRITFGMQDAIYSCSKTRIFSESITHAFSSKSWFNASTMEKVLKPREKYVYRFSIVIPKDQDLRGTYWSVIMVNVEKPVVEGIVKNGVQLNSKIRYAVGLYTNVNSFDTVDLDFDTINLKKDENSTKKSLDIKVLNNSLFIQGVKLTLEIYNDKGVKIHEAMTGRNLTVSGACRDFKIDISKVPKGTYQCVLIADSKEEFVGTNISLNVE
jgi:hypothetical protein